MKRLDPVLQALHTWLHHVAELNQLYQQGRIGVRVPEEWMEHDLPMDEAVAAFLPASQAAFDAAEGGLFYSLPLAFDPSESVGPYLATIDRDAQGEPFRFMDLGAQIATHPFGENELDTIAAVLSEPCYVVSRYAHCEYQTALSLRLKARLDAIAPKGTPRHFVVNTGAETVENAMKAVLLNRVRTHEGPDTGFFVISFEGAFHGRTLGALAVTQRKRARAGFPTFDWPHVAFPFSDPLDPAGTERREEQALRQTWELVVTGRIATAPRSREAFRSDLKLIDTILASPAEEIAFRISTAHAHLSPDQKTRSRRVAGVLVEPIQGEGGVRMARPEFFCRLRVLTAVYGVPLLFDEVQCGGGITGTRWAHELFDLPIPPDAVTWAKTAQNGVLFVSEELASFFQEEKKFNTTWEGDSVGMLRLLCALDKLDLEQVRAVGTRARTLLQDIAAQHHALIHNVRGAGCMLAFDAARPDLRDTIRERAFRRGLLLLPAGERTLRFYPRFDMTDESLCEAARLLHDAVADVLSGRTAPMTGAPERRAGAFDFAPSRLQIQTIDLAGFEDLQDQIMAVETARYGSALRYPAHVLRSGRRPLLQFPVSVLAASIANPRSLCLVIRDRVSQRVVAYALGSPLENYDEEGVRADPRWGEGTCFYLHAMATHPIVKNTAELETVLLDALRGSALGAGFECFSTLIEARVLEGGPAWLRSAAQLRVVDDYLGSGIPFVYLQCSLRD